MTDLNTLMTLMSALKGGAPSDAPSGGMSALLPVLLSVMNARGGTDGGMSTLLPLLMNMAGGAGKPPQNAEASGKVAPSDRDYTAERRRETPFGEIGFAGAEVRSFMETLWRVRRRV